MKRKETVHCSGTIVLNLMCKIIFPPFNVVGIDEDQNWLNKKNWEKESEKISKNFEFELNILNLKKNLEIEEQREKIHRHF